MIADFNGLLACCTPPPPLYLPIFRVGGSFTVMTFSHANCLPFRRSTLKNNHPGVRRQHRGRGNAEEACPSSSYRCTQRQGKWTPALRLHVEKVTDTNQDACATSTTQRSLYSERGVYNFLCRTCIQGQMHSQVFLNLKTEKKTVCLNSFNL